jgi:hypothetical protein
VRVAELSMRHPPATGISMLQDQPSSVSTPGHRTLRAVAKRYDRYARRGSGELVLIVAGLDLKVYAKEDAHRNDHHLVAGPL